MNVSLTRELEQFVQKKVKTGHYQTASEVVREGLRLLEEEDKRKSFTFSTREELEAKLFEGVRQLDGKAGYSAPKVLKQLRGAGETTTGPGLRVTTPAEIAFVLIPAGEFEMGSNENEREKPIHRIGISKQFLLGKYPVTNREYRRFLKANPAIQPPEDWRNSRFNNPQQPVVGVSWVEAQSFCQWAG